MRARNPESGPHEGSIGPVSGSKGLGGQRLRFDWVSGVARQRLSSTFRAGPALVGPVGNRVGPGQAGAVIGLGTDLADLGTCT